MEIGNIVVHPKEEEKLFIIFMNQIPLPEIKDLCNLAIELIRAKRRVEIDIKRGFVPSEDFTKLRRLTNMLIYRIADVLRIYTTKEDYVTPVINDLRKILEFNEYDRKRLKEELINQYRNFPMVSEYIRRVNEILYVHLAGVLTNVLRRRKRAMMREFVLSSYRLRNLKPSPKLMKELAKEEEEER